MNKIQDMRFSKQWRFKVWSSRLWHCVVK